MKHPIDDTDIELRMLIEAVYLKYNYDFRDYTGASQKRRVLVALREMECATVSELQAKVLHQPEAFARLLQFLTIPVTEMFRDPEYHAAIRSQVVPHLSTYPSLKFWVAGCSTGEEVYSLAILLHEEGLLERSLIYATDINPESLEARGAACSRSTGCACTPRTTRRPAASARFPITTRPPMAGRCSSAS